MNEAALFLQAVAALISSIAWPLVIFSVAMLFRQEIRGILPRVKHIKILGQEAELERELDKLGEITARAETETTVPPSEALPETGDQVSEKEAAVDNVLDEAARSPVSALLRLSVEIERELRRIIATARVSTDVPVRYPSIREGIRILADRQMIAPDIGASVQEFSRVRNAIVHGKQGEQGDIVRAIDYGLSILRSLQAVRRPTTIIYHPAVAVFADSRGTQVRAGIQGVILESISPGGVIIDRKVFPTTMQDYKKGMHVTWTWDRSKVWGKSWYRSPDTGQIELAWEEAVEFTGVDLDSI